MKTRTGKATWYVYCLRCRDGSLYTGITTDVERRVREHNAGKGGAYTRAKRPVRLARVERRPTRGSALRREAEIKSWVKVRKEALLKKAKS